MIPAIIITGLVFLFGGVTGVGVLWGALFALALGWAAVILVGKFARLVVVGAGKGGTPAKSPPKSHTPTVERTPGPDGYKVDCAKAANKVWGLETLKDLTNPPISADSYLPELRRRGGADFRISQLRSRDASAKGSI